MPPSDVEADWLQDTLTDVARRLRRSGITQGQLSDCASILERIVSDLRGTPMPETPTVPTISRRTRWWGALIIGLGLFLLLRRLVWGDRNSKP
jgi:hypothetical protein